MKKKNRIIFVIILFLCVVSFLIIGFFLIKKVVEESLLTTDKSTGYNDVRYLCMGDYYNPNDDLSMQRGMRAFVSNADDEKAFIDNFLNEERFTEKTINYSETKVIIGDKDDEEVFMFFINMNKEDYPKIAYGFKYSLNDSVNVAKYDLSKKGEELFDSMLSLDGEKYEKAYLIRPLLDYQKKEYIKDDEDRIIRIDYSSDPKTYGTYNSSGELYFDENEKPLYKVYYATNGTRISYYLYNDKGEFIQFFDFGGMAYKGLDNNPDVEIGIDFETYIFDR